MQSMKHVEPVRLTAQSRFTFRCYKGIDCFTKCCNNIDIMLTPYDIIRMKKRLGISSGEFLNDYTYIEIEEKSAYPFVHLRMKEEPGMPCRFVSPDGCIIYDDRPANCRYYAVGQASLRKQDDKDSPPYTEEFYFLIKEPHCLGHQEDRELTIAEWREEQGVDLFDDMNRGWKDLLFRRNIPGAKLDDKKQKLFYMACYDVDRFRRFIIESGFLDLFVVAPTKLERMKTDDIEMMQFGCDYIKYTLGMEETLKTVPK
ncbi:MAG TPA: YkgJ family cysteine cluster protein [Dissulfurispiraceae bacterium]|nr:YkgJ family cysteine cluster protein [Dissulfurispiraceae bacterium]